MKNTLLIEKDWVIFVVGAEKLFNDNQHMYVATTPSGTGVDIFESGSRDYAALEETLIIHSAVSALYGELK